MKKATCILLIVILFLSLSLNVYFVITFVWGDGQKEGLNLEIGKNKYAGHWTAQEYLPDIYIEDDGTVNVVSISNKKATEDDPYSQYISSLQVGYCEGDNIVITKYAKIYDPNLIQISFDGENNAYYFHSIEDVTEEYFIESAEIWTITSINEDAIEVEGYSQRKISYIRETD